MARDDEAGAVAAAKYFLDLYAYTESTQDTGPWEAMSHPDCVFCKSVMDDVTARLAAGQVVRPATMFVHSVAPTVLNPLAYSVAIDVSTGPDEVRWTDGSLVSAGKRERGVMTTAVVWQAARWIVRDVSLELER